MGIQCIVDVKDFSGNNEHWIFKKNKKVTRQCVKKKIYQKNVDIKKIRALC
jgi:hypothetical protein